MPVGVDVGDLGAELHLDARSRSSWRRARPPSFVAERRQHLAARRRARMTRAVVGSMRRKSRRSVRCASSAIWPAISTPVGPAPTTTNVISRSISGRVGASSASSKAPKMRPAQLEGVVDALHARGVLGELVVAEVGLAGAGRDDQPVVRVTVSRPSTSRGDGPGGEVDVGDLAEHDPGVLLPAQDLAGRRGDLALGEDAGRHLVEQRLEQVVAGRAAIRVTSTSARLSAWAANRPPKPDPMMTTRCRSPLLVGGVVVCGMTLTSRATAVVNRSFRHGMRPLSPP